MANDIKDFSRVIAELEDGQFNVDCSSKLEEALKALRERCDVDGAKTAVAAMTIKLKIILNSGNIEIHADVSSSTPAKPRGRSIFWLSNDGKGICRENPKQPKLPFDVIQGNREVVNYDQERKDING